MKFMVLLENPVFLSLTFYHDPENPQLYLHLNSTHTHEAGNLLVAINGLKTIATHADGTIYLVQPLHLNKSGTLRLDDIHDIALVLNWISDVGYVNFSQRKVLAATLRLFNDSKLDAFAQAWESKFSQPHSEDNSEIDSVAPVSPRTRIISLDQHIAQAFAAVKRGDKKLLEVLLGDGVTDQDIVELENSRIRLDSQTDARFTREFHALVFVYQHTVVEAFLKLGNNPAKSDQDAFCSAFFQCVRDAKEVIIGAKASYPYRPYLLGRDIASIDNFAGWLQEFYEAQSLLPYEPVLNSLETVTIEKIKKDLVKHREVAIDSLMQLDELRSSHGVKFGELEAEIIRKGVVHSENITQLLQNPTVLPDMYQYEGEAEKFALTQLLQSVKVPINSLDVDGNTLLHHAIDKDNREIAIFLIRCDIDVTLSNHAHQTAHAYAGKDHAFLLELQRIAHGEVVLQESQFLAAYKQLSDAYEPTLRRDEEWLQSTILRQLGKFYGLDKEITLEKRRIKNQLDRLYQQAVITGNPEALLKGIETLCPKNKTKRGPRNKSMFYDGALKLARRARADAVLLGTLGAVNSSSVVRLEQTVMAKDQEIARLAAEKAEEAQRNRELATQNTELKAELTTVRRSYDEQQGELKSLKSMMFEFMQRLEQQERGQEELRQSLPHSAPIAPMTQFFASPAASSSGAASSASSAAILVPTKRAAAKVNSLSDSQSVFPDQTMSPMDSNSVLPGDATVAPNSTTLSFSALLSSPPSLNKG